MKNISQPIVCIILIGICSTIAWFVSSTFENSSWERDAVRHGHGEWVFNENGKVQFQWK